ncbi:MAG: helix-turn-helix domain-containing protein [Prevotella sp.]|nr:helix-turn-helix domain-containing protein [Prevotella sp.]MDY3073139.1 helix-turn-helix domain-containing protein [Prevotella sp.]
MLRLQENYSVALFVNIAIFMPVSFMIINSMQILLTNRNLPRKIQTASFGLYLIGIAACIYYRCTRSDEWAVKVICALCFMLHLVMLFLTNMKAYYKLVKKIDNYFDFDAEPLIRFMLTSSSLMMGVSLFTPFIIITNNHILINGLIAIFEISLIYFVARYIRYGNEVAIISAVNTSLGDDNENEETEENNEAKTENDIETPDRIHVSAVDNSQNALLDLTSKLTEWTNQKKYCQQNLTIVILAKEIGTNQKYLSRYFNETCNLSFRDWLNDLRMQEAKKILLDNSNITVESIASECGFTSRTHFHTLFVKMFGMTPSQYRINNLVEEEK